MSYKGMHNSLKCVFVSMVARHKPSHSDSGMSSISLAISLLSLPPAATNTLSLSLLLLLDLVQQLPAVTIGLVLCADYVKVVQFLSSLSQQKNTPSEQGENYL